MEVVGLVFATVATIDLLLVKGSQLARRIGCYQNLKNVVEEVRFFSVEASRSKLREQLLLGQSICRSTTNKDVQKHLNENFEEMQVVIWKVSALLDELDSSAVSFVSFKRRQRKLEEGVKKLNLFRQDFVEHVMLASAKAVLPSARLLSTDQFKIIDGIKNLTTDVRLVRGDLSQWMERVPPKLGAFLIEKNYAENKRDIEMLAEILGSARPSPGILDFVGFRKDPARNVRYPYQLIFSVPEDMSLGGSMQRSLQDTNSSPPSLNSRVGLCVQLASAVLHVYGELGMVHKNINSSNIILAEVGKGLGNSSVVPPALFLTNWRYARNDSAATDLSGVSNWASRLYQHPERQMPRAEAKYSMAHDVYSLGVCMFEILLWTPLVIISAAAQPKPSILLHDMVKHSGIALESTDMGMEDEEDGQKDFSEERLLEQHLSYIDGKMVQKMIIQMAETRLPSAVGDILTGVVVTCLTCLEGNSAPVSFSQGDPVENGMKFIAFIKSSIETVQV